MANPIATYRTCISYEPGKWFSWLPRFWLQLSGKRTGPVSKSSNMRFSLFFSMFVTKKLGRSRRLFLSKLQKWHIICWERNKWDSRRITSYWLCNFTSTVEPHFTITLLTVTELVITATFPGNFSRRNAHTFSYTKIPLMQSPVNMANDHILKSQLYNSIPFIRPLKPIMFIFSLLICHAVIQVAIFEN